MNILLVEPEKALAQTYVTYLTDQGHQVRMCQSAQQAISCCDESRPDIIVLELLLGGHNGVEFLYEFRSYPEWQSVPVLLLSMLAPHELLAYRKSLEQLGVSQCLYKPDTSLAQLEYAITSTVLALHSV